MREKLKDKARLLHILEAIDNIFEFIEGKNYADFVNEKILKFAIIKNLEIIGEAAHLLTADFKKAHPEIEWADIIGMRHVLVHGYYQVRDEIVWASVGTELQPLKDKILYIIDTIE